MSEKKLSLSRVFSTGLVGLLIVTVPIVLVIVFSAWNPVKYGTVEAVTQYGALTGEVFEEGAHWKTPIIQGTRTYNILTHSYETSGFPDESNADFPDFPVTANTADGQQISITYTVLFSVQKGNVLQTLRTWGNMDAVVERVVKTSSRAEVRQIAQEFEAEALFSGIGIQEFESEVQGVLQERFDSAGVTLAPDGFLVRKISFDEDYVQTIENQQIAQENIKTAGFVAESAAFEAQAAIRASEADKQRDILLAEANAAKTLLNANANAEARVISAEANALAVVLEAEAAARSIELRGTALDAYPTIIQMTFIEGLNLDWGVLPMDSVLPLLPLDGITLGQ